MKPKIKIILFLLLLSTMFVGNFAKAQLVHCTQGIDNCQLKDLILVIIRIVNYLYSLAGLFAIGFIVWAGYGMLTAGGNEEKIEGSKHVLQHAIIGFFLILASYLLIDAIVTLLSGYRLSGLFEKAMNLPF